MSGRHVVEGISGLYHYHVAEDVTDAKALCGARTMFTSIKIEDFGVPFGEHFPKRPTWCGKCAQVAGIAILAPLSTSTASKEKA